MEITLIGIAGGTGSGKSTFTNRIKEEFKDDVAVIYYDNYYRRQDHLTMDERRRVNYDSPESLETELLIEHLRLLKEGQAVECPVYDFTQHNRSNETMIIEPRRVMILEGILALENPSLRELMDIKIYVETDADERILRRVQRDVKERGRDIDGIVLQYLSTVKPMHYLYVEPTRALADVVINGGMNDVAFDIVKTKLEKIFSEAKEK